MLVNLREIDGQMGFVGPEHAAATWELFDDLLLTENDLGEIVAEVRHDEIGFYRGVFAARAPGMLGEFNAFVDSRPSERILLTVPQCIRWGLLVPV